MICDDGCVIETEPSAAPVAPDGAAMPVGRRLLDWCARPVIGWDFRRIEAEGFDLFIDPGGRRLPETLVLEARGRSRTVRAYWNDLGWVG